ASVDGVKDRVVTETLSTPVTNDDNVGNTRINSAFLESVFELSEVDREESFNRFLEEHIKSVLEFDADDTLDANLGFFELGMESMQTLSLQQRLEKELSLALSDTALFDYPSINQLSGYLISMVPWDQLEEGSPAPGIIPSSLLNETNISPSPDSESLYQDNEREVDFSFEDAVSEKIENLSKEEVIAELLSELDY
ncbi:MAG: acyl carrier protein, partial [Gammaproteobacteria bacterium]|nr:acyl carrier protein [Gammaproteobacteria bacterium]